MSNTSSPEMQRRPNWLQIVKNTIDQYDDFIHGVQKDAIQNGKDAVPHKLGKKKDGTLKPEYIKNKWKFSFELKEITYRGEGSVKALVMTDFGTTGLIGERRVDDFGADEEPDVNEKWARFESYAMANEGGQTLGARGQGKFVFVWASKRHVIVYDTRKTNGKYRAGWTTVTVGSSPVFAFDGVEGEKWIRKELGIGPVHAGSESTGTRIVIVDPCDELVKRLRSGEFLEHIQETWWPFIRDYGAHIEVTIDGVTSVAKVPEIITKVQEEKDGILAKHWNKDNLQFKFGVWKGKKYTIKEFRIASFTAGGLPEAYRGISVFRGGMKVQAVQTLYGYEFEDRISGYVILNPDVDEKLREVEKPSHYEFKDTGIWKKLEAVIKEEAQKFGVDKLGTGITSSLSQEEKRKTSISKALQIFHFLSKEWPLEFTGTGPGPGPSPGPGPGPQKDIYVSIKEFLFPNPANIPRFDWGQKASGWWIEVGNKNRPDVDLLLECWVSSSSHILFTITNEKILLKTDSVTKHRGHNEEHSFLIGKNVFSGPGGYQLHARISDIKSKKVVDEVVRRFWVQMDPPLRAPFKLEPAEFSKSLPDEVELEWKMQFGSDGNTVWYNIDHPSFKTAANQENESVFLGEVAAMAGIQLVIRNVRTLPRDEVRFKKLPFNYDELFGKDEERRYLETIKMRDRIHHTILSNFLT